AQIRMHHAAGDRSGPDNADLDHQVIKILRFEPRQHRHLSAALDLKHADGVALANHIERRLITLGDRRHRIFDTVMLAQKLETEIELGETAEAEKIDFEESEVFDIDLVPLNYRALRHGGVFDRHQIVHRLVAEQKTAGMNRKMARKVQDFVRQLDQMLVQGCRRMDTHLRQRLGAYRLIGRQKLGHAIESGFGQPQSLADIAQRRARAIAYDV